MDGIVPPFVMSPNSIRSSFGIAVLLWATCGSGIQAASAQDDGPAPTLLGRMASVDGTTVFLVDTVGEIDSDEASAVISAVGLENRWFEPNRARGVRVNLSSETQSEHFFVDASDLARLRADLASMACGADEAGELQPQSARIYGIARCRPSQTIPQAFCPGYRIAPDFTGLVLSTYAGGSYRFPGVKPKAFEAAIAQAMTVLDVDPNPSPDAIDIPDAELEQIVSAAVKSFPELAASPGVKAAGYTDHGAERSAQLIFWPHERAGDIARARMVYCTAAGDAAGSWQCDRSEPRTYLSLPGQADDVVIPGALDWNTAMALIDVTRQALVSDGDVEDASAWWVWTIHPPEDSTAEFWVSWTDGEHLSMFYVLEPVVSDEATGFRIVKATLSDDRTCG